jgi:hypothetical protein
MIPPAATIDDGYAELISHAEKIYPVANPLPFDADPCLREWPVETNAAPNVSQAESAPADHTQPPQFSPEQLETYYAVYDLAQVRMLAKRAIDLVPIIKSIQSDGALSLRQIAAALNERGILTAWNGRWSAVQVQRILHRNSTAQV